MKAAGAASLGMALTGAIFAAPAFGATSVSAVTFTPGSTATGATSTWTIGFTTSGSGQPLKQGATITVTFDSHFVIAASPVITLVSGFSSCGGTGASSSNVVTITLSGQSCNVPKGAVSVTIAGITNPAAGSYPAGNFSVSTSQDSTGASPATGITIYSASKLAFTASPTDATAGTAFATQPQVAVEDPNGNVVANSNAQVTFAATNSTGSVAVNCSPNPVTATGGVATFAGCRIDTAGTYTLTASAGGLTSATIVNFTVSAAAASQLTFVQGPTDAFVGTAMSPAVTVRVQDRFDNPVPAQQVTLTPSSGTIAAGSTATTDATGVATFTGITFNNGALGLTSTAKVGTLSSTPSAPFNVTVLVNNSAAALTDTATDSGAGVGQVAYYYCTGYSGACSNGTLIGSSTDATRSFPVTWTGQPANGAYRVVAVGTDKVGNVSSASSPTPVTVSNSPSN